MKNHPFITTKDKKIEMYYLNYLCTMTSTLSPFHLAIPVDDLEICRNFYVDILGCPTGRTSENWVDLNFFGHQVVLHKTNSTKSSSHNPVDGHEVPVPHFGVVLEWNAWHKLADKLKAAGVKFQIEPYLRFKGEVGEQATMFFYDPSGNAIEFKAFKNPENLFAV